MDRASDCMLLTTASHNTRHLLRGRAPARLGDPLKKKILITDEPHDTKFPLIQANDSSLRPTISSVNKIIWTKHGGLDRWQTSVLKAQ